MKRQNYVWHATLSAARNATLSTLSAARNATWSAATWSVARDAAVDAIRNTARGTARHAAWHAAWLPHDYVDIDYNYYLPNFWRQILLA